MYKKLNNCVCCDSSDLFEILDLGNQPLANSFHSNDKELEKYELKLMGCDRCSHTQLSVAVDPSMLFNNYLYLSGTSNTLKNYFNLFALIYSGKIKGRGKIIDIACNDGSQLDMFKRLGWGVTVGVEPATNLVDIASSKGHLIINSFWNTEVAEKLHTTDLIIAQNVFAHTSNPLQFLLDCKKIMNPYNMLVIQTSQAEMFKNNEFDTIYHEHISFFSVLSMATLVNRAGLYLNHVYKTDIHGKSYVFEIGVEDKRTSAVVKHITDESDRLKKDFYVDYANHAKTCLKDLHDIIKVFKKTGKKVIGYGAAAKGMTVLNADNIQLDYIIDDSPLKQNLFCPGINTPIYSSEKLYEEQDDIVIVPLAWNFFDEIYKKVKSIRPDNIDQFIKYFPKLSIKK